MELSMEPVLIKSNKNIIGQIAAVFFIEASITTAFAVFFSGLSLYLTHKELYSKESAAIMTGLFLSAHYFLQLVGGVIANRLITYKKLYCLGSIMSVVGCVLLAYGANLKVGLSLFLMSSLVTNVCLRMFITRLFDDSQVVGRRIAFVWNYVGMNLGFLMGGFLAGYYTIKNNYFNLYIIMSILIVISVILTLVFIKNTESDYSIKRSAVSQVSLSSLIMLSLVGLMIILFNYVDAAQKSLTIISIVAFVGLLHYGYRNSALTEKNNFMKFSLYSALSVCFWTIYMLTPTAIMQIIDNDVQQTMFGITIAPQWIVNIDTIVILIGAPTLAYFLNRQTMRNTNLLGTDSYFTRSFLFTTIAFVALLVGLYSFVDQGKLPIIAILAFLIFLTLGEILISPISDSLVGELVPVSMRELMTGISSVKIGIGGLLASSIANKFLLPYVDKDGLVGSNLSHLQGSVIGICVLLAILTATIYFSFARYKTRESFSVNIRA